MHLRIEKGGIVFTDDHQHPIDRADRIAPAPPWSVPYSTLEWDAPSQLWAIVHGRIARNEWVFLDQLDAFDLIKESPIDRWMNENLTAIQVINSGFIRPRMDVSPDEFIGMQTFARSFIPTPTDARMSHLLLLDESVNADRTLVSAGYNWVARSYALSWMIAEGFASALPVLQHLGYGYEAARHMDTTIADWVEPPFSAGLIDTRNKLRSFVDHVNVAAKCALDTPQPVTLSYGPNNVHTATFENRRFSPSVRGLYVTLPTGGYVFLRGAELIPGSDSILHKGRALPARKLAYLMIDQTAFDLMVSKIWNHRCGYMSRMFGLQSPDTILAEVSGWTRTTGRPPMHRPHRYPPPQPAEARH